MFVCALRFQDKEEVILKWAKGFFFPVCYLFIFLLCGVVSFLTFLYFVVVGFMQVGWKIQRKEVLQIKTEVK